MRDVLASADVTAMRLALFASHGGTNLQAILDACVDGTIKAEPVLMIGNNSKATAFERARKLGIKTVHLSSHTHPDPNDLDGATLAALQGASVDFVALAGYMKKLGPKTVDAFRNRIVNIHPGLLPEYGGPGMYGRAIYEKVLTTGASEAGATIHLVDEQYDHGRVLAERRVAVLEGDTPQSLEQRVRSVEHALYVDTLRRIAEGEVVLG